MKPAHTASLLYMIDRDRRFLSHDRLLYHLLHGSSGGAILLGYAFAPFTHGYPDSACFHAEQGYSEAVAPITNASTSLNLPRQKGSLMLCPALMIVTSRRWR